MQVITEGVKIPIKNWATDLEEGALEQAKNLANLPFAFKHIALMPDAHQGYGMPIGGVLATEGVVVPNAVGVDIGCGMNSVKTNILTKDLTVAQIKEIMGLCRKAIPMGVGGNHKEKQDQKYLPMPSAQEIIDGYYWIVNNSTNLALSQIGTLGSGNHFIEIQKGTDGYVYIMIHSGSRGLGKKVCDHYNEIAKKYNKQWYSDIDDKAELAFLPLNSTEGQQYIKEMQYCVDYALASRKLMMERVMESFKAIVPSVEFEPMINIAHNYASLESHYGKNVWVHRKGATLAREGTIGIIPGSQGTKSYIVRGKGNPESFMTCSHGAGRAMGRKEAVRSLNLAEQIKIMDDAGIVHGIRTAKELDEAPSAYKNIDTVMENQKDLVDIVMELRPMGVLKGD